MTPLPASARRAHHVEDLGLGADVDAGGGFVHDQHVRVGAEPLGDDDLLLVAAGEQPNGSTGVRHLDLKSYQQILGQRLAGPVGDERAALQLSEQGQQQILPDGVVQDQALQPAVLRDQRDAVDGSRREGCSG